MGILNFIIAVGALIFAVIAFQRTGGRWCVGGKAARTHTTPTH